MYHKPRALLIRLLVFLLTVHLCLTTINDIQNDNLNFLTDYHIYVDKDPRIVTNEKTHLFALKQTIYARNLMYYPNEVLTGSFAEAAGNLFKFMVSLEITLVRSLGARILNKEGILFYKGEGELIRAIERLAYASNKSTVNDRLVCIALLGDIGAMFSDTGATTGIYGRTVEQANILTAKFKDFSKNLNNGMDYFTEVVVTRIKHKRGSSAVGPHKSEERKRLTDETRSGIFNYGEKADEILGIENSQRMIKTTWGVGTIEEARLSVLEPWAGHMSGSPSEILHVWDALTAEDPLVSYRDSNSYETRNLLRSQRRTAKAAGASAFLVAMGYHSAMECVEGTFAYLGQDFRLAGMISPEQDAGYFLQNGASTSLMSGLFKEVTRHDQVFNFSE